VVLSVHIPPMTGWAGSPRSVCDEQQTDGQENPGGAWQQLPFTRAHGLLAAAGF
jgi:hypothetical protein